KTRRKTVLKEFKEFVMRGYAMDMAVGIIIGAAFSKDDAAARPLDWQSGFLELLPQLEWQELCVAVGSQIGPRSHTELRHFPEQRHQIFDCRLRRLSLSCSR